MIVQDCSGFGKTVIKGQKNKKYLFIFCFKSVFYVGIQIKFVIISLICDNIVKSRIEY